MNQKPIKPKLHDSSNEPFYPEEDLWDLEKKLPSILPQMAVPVEESSPSSKELLPLPIVALPSSSSSFTKKRTVSSLFPNTPPLSSELKRSDKTPLTESSASKSSFIYSLSILEKTAIVVVLISLFLFAGLSAWYFLKNIPPNTPSTRSIDYPISGDFVKITNAAAYWREPVQADLVQAKSTLIPELKINLGTSSGAIRVFYKDNKGQIVGDPINREVQGNEELLLPATKGFDDASDYASYQLGTIEPWIVEIFEAPDSTSSREKFKKVLQIEIPAILR